MDQPTTFEWDDAKANANLHKHRLSFEAATAIFSDPGRVVIDTARVEDGERRLKIDGVLQGRLCTAVFVMRGRTCRLISARRANSKEERTHGQG